ncbi:unnamed protein product [marine sediment metagenome]|uniref:Ribbon-helix-helix protein CopG domain-containing protein n=1 Tax=marine sediment metagenome TaxID=412755 RepID=X1CRT6_9ZZZZ
MKQTLLKLPDDVDEELKVYSIRNKIPDKRDAIIKILKEKLFTNGQEV